MIYRTYSLDARNERITRALIVVHGTNRNADHYFDTARATAFLAGALDDTVVIAPHMIDRTDKAEPNEVVWQSSWRTGGPSVADTNLTSFDFVDEILRKVAKKSMFPNLKSIVVTGHSAVVSSPPLSMSNRIHDTLACRSPMSSPIRPVMRGRCDAAGAGRRGSREGWDGLNPMSAPFFRRTPSSRSVR
jgi:hypothetical protein